jgi:hypothetical protein
MGSLNFQRTGKEPVIQGRFFDRFWGGGVIKEPWLGGQNWFFDFFRNWVRSDSWPYPPVLCLKKREPPNTQNGK